MAAFERSAEHGTFVKYCSRCKKEFIGPQEQEVAISYFNKFFAMDKYTVDGFCRQCRTCVSKRNHAKRHNCDPEEMLKAQGGKCAICEIEISLAREAYIKTTAYVDHDHETEIVRELLCHRCNSGLSFLEDRIWFSRAMAYLEKHKVIT